MEKEFSVVCPMADYMRGFRDAGRFKEYCKVCGQYGTCWACPPFDFDTDGYLARYENILLVAVKIDVPCRSEKMSELVKSDDSEILPANDGIADIAIERSMKFLEQTRVVMDRELLEKAFSAKNGDTVRRLYHGEDLRHNHSNSDMSLMNYLAFYSGGNVEQMTRIFATSGLYRPDKPASYYEYTAIKAAKDTPHYTPPKTKSSAPKSANSGNSK